MKDDNDIIKQKFKLSIAMSKVKEEENIVMNKKRSFVSKKVGLVACACLLLTTGIVFAKDIEKIIKEQFKNFGLGSGVDTAVENGYIGITDDYMQNQNAKVIENNQIIDSLNVECRVDKFIITDDNLSLSFNFKIDNKINEYVSLGKEKNENIDYEGSYDIELSDMFIVDENNQVLYFNKYDNKLLNNYGISNNEELPKFNNILKIKEFYDNDNKKVADFVCNITSSEEFPKSKKLNVYFTKINLISPNYTEKHKVTLEGNWEFHLEVPQVMIERKESDYKVLSCEEDNFYVYEAKLNDTEFEFGLKILNVEKPEYPKELIEREKQLLKEGETVERKSISK